MTAIVVAGFAIRTPPCLRGEGYWSAGSVPPISQFDTDPKGNLQIRALLEVHDVAPNFSQVRKPPGEYGCVQKVDPTT